MARIRSLKPEIWQDEALGMVSIQAQCLFVGLITQADDHGRLEASPLRVRALIWPYKPEVGCTEIEGWMQELERGALIQRYQLDGRCYIALPGWRENQRVDRPQDSKIPAPPRFANDRECSRMILLDQGRDQGRDQGPLDDSLRSSSRRKNEKDGHDAGNTASAPVPSQRVAAPPAPLPLERDDARSAVAQPAPHDVEAAPAQAPLCHLLADLIAANGSSRPRVGEKWRTAERLLLERDQRDRSEAERLIRWCQASEFWRANVLSMPKFRERYDQLRLQAQRQRSPVRAAPVDPPSIAQLVRAAQR